MISSMKTTSSYHINFWAGITGNALEYYDTAIFSFLVPFIAPLFFPTVDPITAMVFAYGMLPLGALAKPLGSMLFGRIGDRYGRKKALSSSVAGLALVTGLMGCLPTYEQAGYLAPALMALGRILQNLFIGGEAAGGAVFILEHTQKSKHSMMSSLYGSSTMIGVTAASVVIALCGSMGDMNTLWRVPFWIGFTTAFGALFVRAKAEESPEFDSSKPHMPIIQTLRIYWRPFLAVAAVSGFSSCNYILALILPNGFLPKVSQITTAEALSINSMLLFADMAMLPLFGWLADRLSPRMSMLYAALASMVLSLPLYALFDNASWIQVVIVRTILVILGVWFSAPLHAWIQTLIPTHARYLVLSLGYAVGAQVLGSPAASLSLLLYQATGWVAAPGLYWALSASLAAFCIHLLPKTQEEILRPIIDSSSDRVSDSL